MPSMSGHVRSNPNFTQISNLIHLLTTMFNHGFKSDYSNWRLILPPPYSITNMDENINPSKL